MIALLLSFVSDHGLMLLCGASAFLAAGVVAGALQRSPLHRQRVGELTLLCTLAWLVIACVPMPRWNRMGLHQDVAMPVTPIVGAAATAAPLREIDRSELAQLAAQLARTSAVDHPAIPVAAEIVEPVVKSAPRSMHIGSAFAVAYIAAAGACLSWLSLGHLLLARIILTASRPQPWVDELLEDLASQENVRAPRLLISSRCDRAFSCGLFRPAIVLGRACAAAASPSQLRQILLHELAHVRQRDAWGNALFNVALPVLFFHPLYWHLRGRVSLSRELIADDWAASRGGRSAYARDLLAFAKTHTTRGAVVGAVALFESTTHFYRRIHMLVQRDHALDTRCTNPWRLGTLAACGVALALAGSSLGLRPAVAQTAPAQTVTEEKQANDEIVTKADAPRDRESSDAKRDEERDRLEKQLAEAKLRLADMEAKLQAVQSQQGDVQKLKEFQAKMAAQMRAVEAQRMRAEEQALIARKALEERGAMQNQMGDYAAKLQAMEAQKRDLVEAARKQGLKETGMMGGGAAKLAGPDAAHAGSGSHLDLVNLATSFADAVGAVNIAKARFQRNAEPADRALAEATLDSAVRKAELLRQIAAVEAEQATRDFQRVAQLAKMGAVPESELREAQAKVRILELILGSQSGQKGNYNRDESVKQGGETAR